MSRLQICLDARIRSGSYGGVEQVIIGLASGLAKLRDGNEQYLFLTYPESEKWIQPYLEGPCRTLRVPDPARSDKWRDTLKRTLLHPVPFFDPMLLKSRQPPRFRPVRPPESDGTIEKAGVDVMHFTKQTAFLTKVPSIYHPHDLQHRHLPHLFSPRQRQFREANYQTFCEQAQMVAAVSSWSKRDFIEQYRLPEAKVQVVPFAPVLTEYPNPTSGDIATVREKFGLPETFVYYPAQTWPHKNHIGLLEGLALLRDRRGLAITLVCSGHLNYLYRRIQRQAERLRISNQVRFLGFVSPVEIQCLYKLCRCVIIPTKFEAASFPLWEAFLSGAPAACSDVTSLPEQAGDAALLFDPESPSEIGDAIHRLWTDEKLRAALVERGRRNVARFSWEHTARVFRAHYRRIARRPLTEEDQLLLSMPPLL
ncbi:MAG: glycosyltransferase family 4 protein [Chloroflexi bacterium]|nr:glycosyltransferase family 4 protein [Chloroflexota bacterium]